MKVQREECAVETIDVGKRIKSIRKRKNLTLQEVSEKSGMSATAISAIERNVSSPTVNTLASIGRALGESFSSLLGEDEVEYVVTRAENRERLATDIPGSEFLSLAAAVPDRRFHPKLCILNAGANSGEDFVNHQGDEFFFVLRGAVEVEIDGNSLELKEGDSLYFRGNTPYRWKNAPDGGEAHLLVVTTS
jgi:transcriptional regulator with XRE-family HTH domain